MMITTLAGGARFPSLGDGWQSLQAWSGHLDRLPADADGFSVRYGEFPDADLVAEFVAALAEAAHLARGIGGPASLAGGLLEEPDLVSGPPLPEGLYARLVWLGGSVGNVAGTLAATLESVPAILDPSTGSPDERAEALRAVLCGGGGLSHGAADARDALREVREDLPGLADALKRVTGSIAGTHVLNHAMQEAAGLAASLPRLEKRAADAYRKWTGRSLPPGAGPHPAPAGAPAGEAEAAYRRIEAELARARSALAAKKRLQSDLDGFFGPNDRVAAAVLDLDGQLRRLQALFADTAAELIQLCSIASAEQLADAEWVTRAMGLPAAAQRWRELADGARSFVEDALVRGPASRPRGGRP